MSTAAGSRQSAAAVRPSIQIKIDGHFSSKVYTSGSNISGEVIVKSIRDVAFDSFEIAFTGTSFTRLDFVQQFPTHSVRPFVKLRMPLSEDDLPETRIFEAGQTYTIPFHFVVPHNLTISACSHHVTSLAVRDQHLRLPPTVGGWGADDQAPDMAHVEYAVKARAVHRAAGSTKPVKLMEGVHLLKVLPALPEDAPLDITFRDERYKLSKSKTIRKGLLSAKTGKLTATAAQPSAVMLRADGHGASTSTARINLEFAPASMETTPPKINSVTAKLQALTYFSAAPADDLPNLGTRNAYSTNHSLSYSTTTSLFTLPVKRVSWAEEPVPAARRDSGYSSCQLDDNIVSDSDLSDGRGRRGSKSKSKKPAAPIKHTTSIDVPITIPTSNKKFFLPTFHSCLISRTYTLQLTVSMGATNTSVNLSVPLQLGVEMIYMPQGGELPSFESVMAQDEEAEANEHLRPRVIAMPPPDMQGNSLLPGYDSMVRPAISVA